MEAKQMSWQDILKVNPVTSRLISGSSLLFGNKKPSKKTEEEKEVEKLIPVARAANVLSEDEE
tara:strand:- start:4147 stop:4335 length:189 start_codon:yes stop_codon:yes gene_type:complete